MTQIPGFMLERRFIVGTLALDSNHDIAEKARVILGLDESVNDCAKFTADFRRLIGSEAHDSSPDSPTSFTSASSD